MPANFGGNADSRPAVYNEKSTGTSPSDVGPISDLQAQQESKPALQQQEAGEQVSDTHGTAINQAATLQADEPIRIGKVLLAFPYIHCYKIQLSGRQGTCIATAVSRNSHLPLGVKSGDVIPPNSMVLVWKPRDSTIAYILGVIPTPTMSDEFNISDHIQQGGNSGPKKVEAYRNIVKSTNDSFGWVSQSSGRPMDGTVNEYVRMSETGIGLLIDSFQAYLRVNEVCGLWLNYFDNYAKLAALSLNVMSYCEHNLQYYDEGELYSMKGYATYPWESTGMYDSGTKFSKSNEAREVQLDKEFPFALEDIEDYAQTPIYRLTDYTGYVGQGFNRTLMKPAKESGKRLLTDSDNDNGLFQELVALDGSYSVRSAKQILFTKYPVIPNPRRKRQVEDAKGDDLKEENDYKFSGKFGDGKEHKVRDWDDSEETDIAAQLRPAGVLDIIAHHYNWKSTHPFHYHTKDYNYPEESELGNVTFLMGKFNEAYVQNTETTQLKIDDRYNNVKYYNTASFFSLLEDGSIVLGDGYGSQITMTGGQIRLEAAGDIMLASGSRVITLSREAIVRAKDHVDISASEKDVRIKAEKNLQMLGGNSGQGGVLIESKAKSTTQNYDDKIGEDVTASGIMLLARGGNVSTVTQTIYMRSGVAEGNADSAGSIIIDCAKGRGYFASYANFHGFFNSSGLGIWHQPVGESANIDKSHYFGPSFAKINGPTVMERSAVICKRGSLGVDDSVYAKGNIMCIKYMACLKGIGGLGDSSKGGTAAEISRFVDDFCEAGEAVNTIGPTLFQSFYSNFIWKDKQPGNSTLLSNKIGFSYRDKTSKQEDEIYGYSKDKFFLLETRWQQLVRTGLAQGDNQQWQEKPVQYQGNSLYPWPGKRDWVDRDAFVKYENQGGFLLFDTAGYAKDRNSSTSDYEEPRFSSFQKETCESGYKL